MARTRRGRTALIGDPARATAEHGRRHWQVALDAAMERIAE